GRPMVPPDITQYFIPTRSRAAEGQSIVYLPMLLGVGEIHVSDTKKGLDTTIAAYALCAITTKPIPVNWDDAQACEIDASDLEKDPSDLTASFADLPPISMKA